MGVAKWTPIDPLGNVPSSNLYDWSLSLCDCAAKDDDRIEHSWNCNVWPIFAEIVDYDMIDEIRNDFFVMRMTVMQHVIHCAICGGEMLGKDAQVIYEAPLNFVPMPGNNPGYRYPRNIVRAVCPRHNRAATNGT